MAAEYRVAESIFREFLAARGLRLTAPRRAALRAVMSLERHFGLPELKRKMAGGAHRATLYRTLPLLEEAGIIRRVREELDHWHYEHLVGHEHHDHLLCVGCGKVIEVASPAIEREQKRLCRRHGFRERSHSFIVRGLCAGCRDGRQKKQRKRKS